MLEIYDSIYLLLYNLSDDDDDVSFISQCFFAALFAVAFALPTADPKPEAKPEAKPGLIATTYTAPIIPATRILTYNAPLTYPNYIAPIMYNGYPFANQYII